MPTSVECVCCNEVNKIMDKLAEDNIDESCITLHPGFSDVCLSVWVLQTAYSTNKQHNSNSSLPSSINE